MILARSGQNQMTLGIVSGILWIGGMTIPQDMQGRIFAVRNAIQYCTIPTGILLGGFLADYVLEPFMRTEGRLPAVLHLLTGEEAGSGMAVSFLCTGILGFFCYKKMKNLESEVQE